MTYPYISIDPVIAELQDIYKRMNAEGTIDTETCYSSAVECIRLIGGNSHELYSEVISFRGMTEKLPINFYRMQEVWQLGPQYDTNAIYDLRSAFICTTKQTNNCAYQKQKRMFAGNSASLRYVHPDYSELAKSNDPCYIVKSPPATITVTHPKITIGISYEGLKRDEQGHVMMQDEPHSILAVKWWMLLNCIREDYIKQKIPRYIYKDIESDYYAELGDAQDAQKESSEEDQYRFIKHQQQRFDRFNTF